MESNQILVLVIGLFLVVAGVLYLMDLKKKDKVNSVQSIISWVIVAIGVLVSVWPITETINSKIEVEETQSDLMGLEAYDVSEPRNSGSHEDASSLYGQAVALWNDQKVGYDSADIAMSYFDRSIATFETAEAYTARGQLKVQMGFMEQAFSDYNRAIELNDKFGNAYYNRATLNYILGNTAAACADWKSANELGVPNTEEVLGSMCN